MRGVANLVTALNRVPGVMTPGSCQPGPDRAGDVLHARPGPLALSVWRGGNNALPLADVTCLPYQARAVADAVRSGPTHVSC
jgi:hypothetical protein